MAIGENRGIAAVMRTGHLSYENLDPVDTLIFCARMTALFDHLHVAKRIYEEGLLTQSEYQIVFEYPIALIEPPGGKAWWNESGQLHAIYETIESMTRDSAVETTTRIPWLSRG